MDVGSICHHRRRGRSRRPRGLVSPLLLLLLCCVSRRKKKQKKNLEHVFISCRHRQRRGRSYEVAPDLALNQRKSEARTMGPHVSADGGDKLCFQPDVRLARCRLGPKRRLGRLVFRWTGLHRPWTWNSLSLFEPLDVRYQSSWGKMQVAPHKAQWAAHSKVKKFTFWSQR